MPASRDVADHRPSRRQAHVVDHARAHQRGAGDLLCDRGRDRPSASRRDEAQRKAAHERAALLTPIAKAFSTDIGSEVSSLGVQVHGGMGYIEETGAAQFYRDARIARDLRGHQRHPGDRSRHAQAAALRRRDRVRTYIDELRATVAEVEASNDPAFGATGRCLGDAVQQLDRATSWLLTQDRARARHRARRRHALSAPVRSRGRRLRARQGRARRAARRQPGAAALRSRASLPTNIANAAAGLAATVIEGADALAIEPDAIG